MKTAIYKAVASTPFGDYMIAVDSIEHYAKSEIRNAASKLCHCHVAMITVADVTKSNRKLLSSMTPALKTDWIWAKKLA